MHNFLKLYCILIPVFLMSCTYSFKRFNVSSDANKNEIAFLVHNCTGVIVNHINGIKFDPRSDWAIANGFRLALLPGEYFLSCGLLHYKFLGGQQYIVLTSKEDLVVNFVALPGRTYFLDAKIDTLNTPFNEKGEIFKNKWDPIVIDSETNQIVSINPSLNFSDNQKESVSGKNLFPQNQNVSPEYNYQVGLSYFNQGQQQTAMNYFAPAADQGYAPAQTMIGYGCYEGIGIKKDGNRALEWFKKAAYQGEPDAQYYLGYIYSQPNGNMTGIPQNDSLSLYWLELAANQNQNLAQSLLGMYYWKRATKDSVTFLDEVYKAYHWLYLASANGKNDIKPFMDSVGLQMKQTEKTKLKRDALIELEKLDKNGGNALHRAFFRGDTACVMFLLREGFDCSLTDSSGRTALDWAKKTHQQIIQDSLAQKGCKGTDIPFCKCMVKSLQFFQNTKIDYMPAEKRIYTNSFTRSDTLMVGWQLNLEFPVTKIKTEFNLVGVYYQPGDSTPFFCDTMSRSIEKGWTTCWIASAFGYKNSANWKTGIYRIELIVDDRQVAFGKIEVSFSQDSSNASSNEATPLKSKKNTEQISTRSNIYPLSGSWEGGAVTFEVNKSRDSVVNMDIFIMNGAQAASFHVSSTPIVNDSIVCSQSGNRFIGTIGFDIKGKFISKDHITGELEGEPWDASLKK